MRLRLPALSLLLSLFWITSLSADTYYLDFTGGSNGNDGLSPARAWKDLFKISGSSPSPGDVFLFKRGERWEGLQWYIAFSGTAGQPITFGAYGDAADPPPVISCIGALPGSDQMSNWTDMGANIWTLPLTTRPGRLFLDGVEYLRSSEESGVGQTDNEGAFGHWYWDGDTQLLHLYATQNPATLYSEITGSSLSYSVIAFYSAHLRFENLDLRGGFGASLAIFGGANIEVENCRLGHSGNSGILLLDADVNGSSQASTYITVRNNLFDSNFTFFYGLGSERGCGDGLRLADGVNNCSASGNVFRNWAHNAIELVGDELDASGTNDNQFFDNFITAPDIPYAHPFGADGLLDKCRGNVFYRNYIENCRTASQINGNDNWVHHNIIVGMEKSPSKSAPTAHAFILGIYDAGLVSQNNRFDHNLIIDTDESGFLIRGYGFPGQTKDHEIRNNIFYETGQAPYNNAYAPGTGIVIYDTASDGVGGNTFQNNLFYSSLPNVKAVYLQDAAAYYTAAQFNALDGTDGNTIDGNLAGDPLFTDFAAGNYLPADNSPAVHAGTGVGLTLDYALNSRIVGPAPDIGPYETDATSVLPVEWGYFRGQVTDRRSVRLEWQTLTEVNAEAFHVERRSGQGAWREIGRVSARGFSYQPVHYEFADEEPPGGVLYYRLRQVDYDGQWKFSKIISCIVPREDRIFLTRPDRETLRIQMADEWEAGRLSFTIFDGSGKRWRAVRSGRDIDVGGLPAGIYLLTVEREGETEVLRFWR